MERFLGSLWITTFIKLPKESPIASQKNQNWKGDTKTKENPMSFAIIRL